MTSIAPSPVASLSEHPLERVLGLGRRAIPTGILLGILGAGIVHGAAVGRGLASLFQVAAFAQSIQFKVIERQRGMYDIDMSEPEKPPEKPPEPEEEPEKAQPKAQHQTAEPPPPAQAGKVLTSDPDPDEPMDFTGDGFIQGDGEKYAGGTTSSTGSSKVAVKGPAKPDSTAPVTNKPVGPATTEQAVDKSRPPRPTSTNWNCGFPPEADFDQIDYATVQLAVTVGTDGRAKSVSIMSDPGHGFGRLARSCAMRMTYQVGYDKAGSPVVKTTRPFPVRFTR
jgi:periplasmic protein TonB